MKVLLTIAGLAPEFGGPSRSVPALAEALAEIGADVELITCHSATHQTEPRLPCSRLVRSRLLPYEDRSRWAARRNGFWPALRECVRASQDCVIHDNGLWLPCNHAVVVAARSLKKPLIVSPRGMLTEWAIKFKGLKKRLAWLLYQRRDLQSAQVLHATSREEADGFRKLGLRQPIAIIPNGVELDRRTTRQQDYGTTGRQDDSVPWSRGPWSSSQRSGLRTLLFLSRLHPVKGLQSLVEAWAALRPKGWQVVLAGEDVNGHRAELETAIRAQHLEADFNFIGPVDGERKWKLYRSADLFVLPSHSENFGMVVAEALACEVPVITTRGTPWKELADHQCGWWEEIGAAPLARALQEAMALGDEERRDMGRRGRQLVEQKYSWPGIAAQMCAVYRWMLGQEAKPGCLME